MNKIDRDQSIKAEDWCLILEGLSEAISIPSNLEIIFHEPIEIGQILLGLRGSIKALEAFLKALPDEVVCLSIKKGQGELFCLPSGLKIFPYPLRKKGSLCLKIKGAFGSGLHPTTRLCLSLLDELTLKESALGLDWGAGSGILSLVAAKKGARVVSLELDLQAAQICAENVSLNGLGNNVWVVCGSLDSVKGRFNLIMANLYLRLLIPQAAVLQELLLPGGWLLLSGFWESTLPQIRKAYKNFQIVEIRTLSPWAGVLLKKIS